MMEMPLVSVIVPVYKVEAYLDQCVGSIVDQTYNNLEIILVDDGSPDLCPAMCDAWAAKDSRIRVIHKQNGGLPDARNAGIAAAKGEWMVFADSDDVLSCCLIEELLKCCFGKHILPVAGYIRFREVIPEDCRPNTEVRFAGKNLSACRQGMYCNGALYNRELVNEIQLRFDISLCNLEDVAWNAVYLQFIDQICFVSTPMYYYRHNPSSITSRCVDRKWQVKSWICARNAVLRWFAQRDLSAEQRRGLKDFFRLCQNNIIAESVEGRLSWPDFRSICEECDLGGCETAGRILGAEYEIMGILPRTYFTAYSLAMKLRNAVVNGRKVK